MIWFVLCAVALAAAAALLLTRAAWWPGSDRGGGDTAEVTAFRQQLTQLAGLHAAGALDDEQFAQSKAQVERRLLDALATPGAAGAAPARPSRRLALGLTLFLAAVAAGGYAWIGSPDHLVPPPAPTAAAAGADAGAGGSAPHGMTDAQIAAMVGKLQDHLQAHPDDAEGWQMLARTYAVLGRSADAVATFAKALPLRPDDPNLLADYADALAMANGRNLQGEPMKLIERALKIAPDHNKALALAGTAAFDRKDYKEAVRDWERLVRVAPPDSPLLPQARASIDEARRLGGLGPAASAPASLADATSAAAAPPGATPAAAAGPDSVAGTVTLAPALRARAQPDDSVFIFARAADGPPMPLAVLRRKVSDLPLQFSLDDRNAMSPAARLSGAGKVIVGARISHSGNPIAQAGDLQGHSAPVPVGTHDLRLQIDEVVSK